MIDNLLKLITREDNGMETSRRGFLGQALGLGAAVVGLSAASRAEEAGKAAPPEPKVLNPHFPSIEDVTAYLTHHRERVDYSRLLHDNQRVLQMGDSGAMISDQVEFTAHIAELREAGATHLVLGLYEEAQAVLDAYRAGGNDAPSREQVMELFDPFGLDKGHAETMAAMVDQAYASGLTVVAAGLSRAYIELPENDLFSWYGLEYDILELEEDPFGLGLDLDGEELVELPEESPTRREYHPQTREGDESKKVAKTVKDILDSDESAKVVIYGNLSYSGNSLEGSGYPSDSYNVALNELGIPVLTVDYAGGNRPHRSIAEDRHWFSQVGLRPGASEMVEMVAKQIGIADQRFGVRYDQEVTPRGADYLIHLPHVEPTAIEKGLDIWQPPGKEAPK